MSSRDFKQSKKYGKSINNFFFNGCNTNYQKMKKSVRITSQQENANKTARIFHFTANITALIQKYLEMDTLKYCPLECKLVQMLWDAEGGSSKI